MLHRKSVKSILIGIPMGVLIYGLAALSGLHTRGNLHNIFDDRIDNWPGWLLHDNAVLNTIAMCAFCCVVLYTTFSALAVEAPYNYYGLFKTTAGAAVAIGSTVGAICVLAGGWYFGLTWSVVLTLISAVVLAGILAFYERYITPVFDED